MLRHRGANREIPGSAHKHCRKNTAINWRHTHKGHRAKVLNVVNFRDFRGVFKGFSGCFQVFFTESGSFRCHFLTHSVLHENSAMSQKLIPHDLSYACVMFLIWVGFNLIWGICPNRNFKGRRTSTNLFLHKLFDPRTHSKIQIRAC